MLTIYDRKNNTVEVLGGINIEVKSGEFISIVGESGCGKSTLLKMITALEDQFEIFDFLFFLL